MPRPLVSDELTLDMPPAASTVKPSGRNIWNKRHQSPSFVWLGWHPSQKGL